MPWADIVFAIPPAFAANAASGSSVTDALLSTPIIDELNPDALFTTGPITGGGSLSGFSQVKFKHLSVHPWQQMIGQGNGYLKYLSPRNAVNIAADKFFDAADTLTPNKNDIVDVLALLVTGASYADFAKNLNRLLAVFSEPTLYMCARRSAQIAAVEVQKTTLPEAAVNARWNSICESNHYSWCDYTAAVGHVNSFGFANQFGAISLEESVMLVADKKAALAVIASDEVNEVLSRIGGGEGKVFFIKEQTITNVRKILLASDTGFEYPLSACVIYCGAPDSLNHMKEFFSA